MSVTSKFKVLLVTAAIGFTCAMIGPGVTGTTTAGVATDVHRVYNGSTRTRHPLPDCLGCGLTD